MALRKKVLTPGGVTADYHRVTRVESSIMRGTETMGTSIIVSIYRDEAAAKKENADTLWVKIFNQENPLVIEKPNRDGILTAAYIYLKTLADYSDAEDC